MPSPSILHHESSEHITAAAAALKKTKTEQNIVLLRIEELHREISVLEAQKAADTPSSEAASEKVWLSIAGVPCHYNGQSCLTVGAHERTTRSVSLLHFLLHETIDGGGNNGMLTVWCRCVRKMHNDETGLSSWQSR